MVESLRELNKLVQKPHYKTKGNWYARHVVRDAALPLTWVLLHFKVTANQVTFASILIGALGVAFLACPTSVSFLIGAFLLQLWYLLDHVDGQVARYLKTASLTGRFYDFMMHHFIHGILPFGLASYLAAVHESAFFLVWGYGASISLMLFNLMHDAKFKTYYEIFDQAKAIQIHKSFGRAEERKKNPSLLKKLYMFHHKSVEMHVMMNFLTIVALLNIFIPLNWFRGPIYFYYGLVIPFLVISKMAYMLRTKKIDREFYERYKID